MDCQKCARILTLALMLVLCFGCGGKQPALDIAEANDAIPAVRDGWPAALPADIMQPWERLDAEGRVLSAGRTAGCINAQSEFRSGVEREQSSLVGVSDNGEAVRLSSGDADSGEVSWTQWRLTMGGEQPGAVSADVNLLPMSDGGPSEYYLGLSNYAAGRWDWHGPFRDSHVRLSTAADAAQGAGFLSPLGNLFMCAVACNGAVFDVVGVAANPQAQGDTEAPPVPAGLSVTPIAGGLELRWDDVIAGDLAGYRVYWRDSWFYDQQATGIKQVDWLEGQARHMLLTSWAGSVYIRVSAIDLSGNESGLSGIASATPLPGAAPGVRLAADSPSGMLNEMITLMASGADRYDWDLDGDGIYEVTGDAAGTQQADTSATGVIRPAVRGAAGDGTAVACGSVSLLIAGNARPVANGYAEPSMGTAPLTVEFTGAGTDPDGEIVLYSWDFDGNGSYDWSDPTNSNPPDQVYNVPYLRNVKFRVDDDQGAYDVDTVAVLILEPLPGPNDPPTALLMADKTASYAPFTVTLYGADSADPDGSIVKYEWDYNGDGVFDAYSSIGVATYTFPVRGLYPACMRVTDDRGAQDTASLLLTFPSEWSMFGMEGTRNRRSPYVGAQTSNVKWSWTAPTELRSSPVIGADGTVYVGSQWPNNRLYAIGPDGTYKWGYVGSGEMSSSPAVGSDGTIYVGTTLNDLAAVGPAGDLRWSFDIGDQVLASPAVGSDGSIYIVSLSGRAYAFYPDGTVKWEYSTSSVTESSPAIAPDGSVYFGNWDNEVWAFGPDGVRKDGNWPFLTGDIVKSSPAIGADGTIYIGCWNAKLYAINPDGTEKWSYTMPSHVNSSPAIGVDGTIYVGCDDSKVYAIDSSGSPLGGSWPFTTGGDVDSSPAIGGDGTIYVGSQDGKVYAINPDGTEKWSYATGGEVRSSPAIGSDGTVYIGSDDMELYAFGPSI